MAAAVESWDDDVDFQGDLFTHSVSTLQTSISSRLSVNSESNLADEDWQVQVSSNDDASAHNAIQSAKNAGVPIPSNVPASALVGGSIKRLGKKESRQKLTDDWAEDLDFPPVGGLALRPRKLDQIPAAVDADEEGFDDFDEWAEGSLGIRFAGTKKQSRNRSSSTSAMSPSLGSQTAESEDDDLRGLEFPEGPVDLNAVLRKRQAAELAEKVELPRPEEPSVDQSLPLKQPQAKASPMSPQFLREDDDFFDDLDVNAGDLDPRKLTLHKNVKQKPSRSQIIPPARAPTTTLTFTDKPAATRIPRPVTNTKPTPSRLEPVMEPGAISSVARHRLQPTTTSAQLLRSKRSMPVMKGNYQLPTKSSHTQYMSTGANAQAQHTSTKNVSYLRRDSDPHRALSPPPRSFSRLSNAFVPDTPSRTSRRLDVALIREATSKRVMTKPQKKKYFGDGSELEVFDDLPISTTKESKFLKQPSMRTGPKTLRNIPSRLDLRDHASGRGSAIPDRMTTPLPGPQTPRSPLKVFQEPSSTPRYLRDTAASRIARESRLTNTNARPRSEGPLMPMTTNWKAQVAARSPHTSPIASRNKGRRVQPGLIKPGDTSLAKNENGMTFNPATHRWEGNENSLAAFDFPPPIHTPSTLSHQRSASYLGHHDMHPAPVPSPPRPALIAPMSATTTQNIQVVGGMVFDPVKMCWLKFRPEGATGGRAKTSLQLDDDDDDPFADIDDLKETNTGTKADGKAAQGQSGLANDEWLVGEEFDLGPEFIRRQEAEEVAWRRRCESWFVPFDGRPRRETQHWRWRIREIAGMGR